MSKKLFINAVIKKADGSITFVASDETLDRGGEVIPIESWDLKNFKKNPVLLVNHDYKVENIVGRAKNIRVEDKSLLFEPDFHGITQLSREVEEMVNADILNTVSVGFMPHGPKKDGDMGTNELFEISFVPVPANPSAERLNAILSKAVEDEAVKKQITDWAVKSVEEKKPEEKSPMCRMDGESKKECVARKIPEIMKDDPSMDNDQAVAMAESMCSKKCDAKGIAVEEDVEIKSGRVLSEKNRKLIGSAVDILKNSVAALDELLSATEPTKSGKDDDDKGRDPEVVKVQSEDEPKAKLPSAVLRALQGINRETNGLLKEFKQ